MGTRFRRPVAFYGSEAELQGMLCDYVRTVYPSALFRSDFASGMKLTPGQAMRHKKLQSNRAFVDWFCFEPRHGFHGLGIELKREGTTIYKRDGSLVANTHIQEQAAMLDRLRKRGYKAEFAVGWDEARRMVDEYLKDKTQRMEVF